MILHFTELPLCIDTEDITMSPAVTDVTYSIYPEMQRRFGSIH